MKSKIKINFKLKMLLFCLAKTYFKINSNNNNKKKEKVGGYKQKIIAGCEI